MAPHIKEIHESLVKGLITGIDRRRWEPMATQSLPDLQFCYHHVSQWRLFTDNLERNSSGNDLAGTGSYS
jgi:hypothetical protein